MGTNEQESSAERYGFGQWVEKFLKTNLLNEEKSVLSGPKERYIMNQRIFGLLLIGCMSLQLSLAQPATLLKAVAHPGDGVFSLLDKFYIRTSCNLSYFYEINKLRPKQGLHVQREYQLPIFVYTYNGKSIRSTTGIDDRPWAEKIQQFNDLLYQRGLKPGDYRKDKQLWVPYHQIYCQEEEQSLPTANQAMAPTQGQSTSLPLRGTYEIFGDKYAKVPLQSTALNGCVYYVVAGHGGPDPGAVGKYGRNSLCEDEYAYDVALRLTRNLLSNGATVYLITRDGNDGIREGEILPCDKDETSWGELPIPAGQKERLTQRSDAVNQLYQLNRKRGVAYQRMVAIHIDSDSKKERIDMYFYHKQGDDASFRFAWNLKETIRRKYDEVQKGRGYTGSVSSRDLHMLRETEPTSVFIELGNIRNRGDQNRLIKETNRQYVADWLFEGMILDVEAR